MAHQSPSPELFFDTISACQRTEALRAAIEARPAHRCLLLCHDPFHHFAMYVGEVEVAALEAVRQALVVESQEGSSVAWKSWT